ncbi:cellobiose dehydrogenase-like protein [Massariosphaeria phaeospora]|uniref:Cellobiose dehydrogenase-like protein n=1 Tax=Massariosphaeria phaeospora TaxID=100035 RepID=A0A7C8M9P5_9PLEO|nr:cellobiose dehydrogenase-like protein [Massariosphaeria phaeospora]
MILGRLSGVLAILTGAVSGQAAQRYCDPVTSICYSGWTGGNGIWIGVALPSTTTPAFDTALQIISPIANGWVGFSWGGTMPYVPLTVGWVNTASNTSIYSSRMAFGLSLPQPFDGAEYSYLQGTGYNKTHWTLNVRCKGCSEWHDVDGNLASIDPNGAAVKFAYAYARLAPREPANNRSTFNSHTKFGHWNLDLTLGQNAKFNQLIAANLVPDALKPSSSGVPTSLPTSVRTSTLTSVVPTANPGPIQTGIPMSCSGVSALHFPTLTVDGWKATKVAGGLTQPRGVIFDTAGHLLLIQNGLGITGHTIGSDGCLTSAKTIITQRNLNHGIALSQDGKSLYASSATTVFAFDYDSATMSINGSSRAVVTGMDNRGHVTRTLTIPPKHPNLLIVSHGSNDNFDFESGNMKVGRSSIKAYDMTQVPTDGYNYASGGQQLGYGLRNSVGLAFDSDGMLWAVENSSDEIHRGTVDIHVDNPADELNFIGDPSKENTQWYGYPTCYTVWKPDFITDRVFSVGDQFVMTPNDTFSDDTCTQTSVPAKLALQAHSAPLDVAFNKNSTRMYVTFHGSWNRNPPTGYKIAEIQFRKESTGLFAPSHFVNSTAGYKDIFWSPDVEHCSTTQCFRPVSIVRDKYERMYVTSDSGGEGELIIFGRV